MALSRKSFGQGLLFDGDKPEFRVPSMAEIGEVPWNGFNAVSTFSGCGGSSLGLKMAGFRVLWANEFVDSAADVYEMNNPGTIVDRSNVREISGEKVLAEAGLAVGELDLFEGSPPCASFSVVGRREAHWGQEKVYSEKKQRVDDLFFEYARLVDEIRPRVFLAENVTGLMKGVARGYLQSIVRGLSEPGYRVAVKVVDAQWLGVPQRRPRLVFVGVRHDQPGDPKDGFPAPFPYRYTVSEALRNLVHNPVEADAWMDRYEVGKAWASLRYGQKSDRYFSLYRAHPHEPANCVTQMGGVTSAAAVAHHEECRKFSIAELKRLCAFPDDFGLTGSYRQRYERLGRAVPPPMYEAVGSTIRDRLLG